MKNIRFAAVFKLLAFVMAAACIVIVYYRLPGLENTGYGAANADYLKSREFEYKMWGKAAPFTPEIIGMESREAVLRGDYVTLEMLKERKIEVAGSKNNAKEEIQRKYYDRYWFLNPENKLGDNIDVYTAEFRASVLDSMNAELAALEEMYDTSEEALRSAVIEEQAAAFNQREKDLKDLEKYGYYYFARHDGKTLTNTDLAFLSTLPAKVYYRRDSVDDYFEQMEDWDGASLIPEATPGFADIIVAMGESRFAKAEEEYQQKRAEGRQIYAILTAGGLALLLCTVWLIYTAGRRARAPGVHLIWFDHIPLDVALAGAFIGIVALAAWVILPGQPHAPVANAFPANLADLTAVYLIYLLAVAFLTMLSKRAQRREVLSHTLIYKILRFFYRGARSVVNLIRTAVSGGSLARKLLIPMIGYGLATLALTGFTYTFIMRYASAFAFFLGLAGFAALNYWAFKYFANYAGGLRILAYGVKNIKAGDLNYQIAPLENAEINLIAQDVNTITEGLKAAVESELKSERMKVELITNVSHDIKTPLTSVINYSSLLAEENLPEPAAEYAAILKAKSQRLKNLIDDLFLVSKAQSGAVDILTEPLCLNEILAQALAEYAETFEEAGLQTRVRASGPKIMAVGDGARMWRVLSNLLSNAAKYGQPGTRVYFDLYEDAQNAYLTSKNIAGYEMDFDPAEMTERFKRGDEARASEGSGLGLSIAESFMVLQGGGLKIETDGDLFKVTLQLPKSGESRQA